MKTKFRLLAVALMAGGTMLAAPRVSIGVSVGGYGPGAYPPPAYAQYQPPCPGPGYAWVDGYWAPQGGRNVWVNGFWRAPVVSVAPRYVAPPRYDNAYRGRDRDDHDHGREAVRRSGGEGHEDHGGYSNGFRR